MHLDQIAIHDLFVNRVTMEETLSKIEDFIQSRHPHHVVTLDASLCVMAKSDAELKFIASSADLVTPDGAGILWAAKRMGQPLAGRVSGVDIVERLCELSSRAHYRLFFLGAAPGVAQEAAEKLRAKYPGCQIVGARDGFFDQMAEEEVVAQIKAANPDVLFVAMGIPRQERWIHRHKVSLGVPVYIGVGGSFDVHSGSVKRAPKWVQKINMEWLYRLMKNPKKIGKVMTLPKFALMTMRSRRT